MIKEIRYELARLLGEDSFVKGTKVHIYPRRELPGTYKRELAIYSIGSIPKQSASTAGGSSGPVHEYVIFWIMSFDKGQLGAVEDESDDLEEAIYRILGEENYRTALWKKTVFPATSLRPLSPSGTQNVHGGRIIIRVIV